MSGTELAYRMRLAADTLAEANKVYGFAPEHGVWSPERLRKEAEIVATDEAV